MRFRQQFSRPFSAITAAITTTFFFSLPLDAQQSVAGGESGFDTSIEAIEPIDAKVSLSLAGEKPADISKGVPKDVEMDLSS